MRYRAIVGLLLISATAAVADEVIIRAWRDTTLYEDDAGSLGNGAGEYCFAGLTAAGDIRRALVAFDVAAALPATATVRSAGLRMFMSRTIGGFETVSVHRCMASWGEGDSDATGEEGKGAPSGAGDATWIHRFYPDTLWTASGGEFEVEPSAGTGVGPEGVFYEWNSAALAADVQSWVDDPATNLGWIMIGDEKAMESVKRFNTREHSAEYLRPALSVRFDPGCLADFNGDGRRNVNDFIEFQAAWRRGERRADFDHSGAFTVEDFVAYQAEFARGCR